MDSILTYVKKKLGDSPDGSYFDDDIIGTINSTFAILAQMGVGPVNGYFISNSENQWNEITDNAVLLEMIKQYIYLQTKLIFDPPTSSFLLENINKRIEQLEFRMTVEESNNGGEIT